MIRFRERIGTLVRSPALLALVVSACDSGSTTADRNDGAPTADQGFDAGFDAAVSPDAGPIDGSVVALWNPQPPPEVDSAFHAAHPDSFSRLSRWSTRFDRADRPKVGALGAYGIGNGIVFGFVGYSDPLNTLHSLTGPTYERGESFFADYRLDLVKDDAELAFDHEWSGRSLTAPVALTSGLAGAVDLQTIDFVPWTDQPARRCLLRMIIVQNRGDSPAEGLSVQLRSILRATPEAGRLIERLETRSMASEFIDAEPVADGRTLRVAIPTLAPGAEWRTSLAHCTAEGTEPGPTPALNIDDLLDETTAAYADWRATHTQFRFPDPMVSDFVDGMAQTLKVQTTETGGVCPMSQYTRVWARDSIGPGLGYLALGAHEDATRLVDFLDGAIRTVGGLQNSYDADIVPADAPAGPDWEAMPSLSGRVGAETPSYMVWLYAAQALATGDRQGAERHLGFLRYALMTQAFDAQDRLPFTGDETFRAAMNAAFGLALDFVHSEQSWSTNSSLLWLGASRHLERLADHLEAGALSTQIRTRREAVEAATLRHYRRADGCFRAFMPREGDGFDAPYEDVSLKVGWAGWQPGRSPIAVDSVGCLVDLIGDGDGGLLSEPDEPMIFFGERIEAVYTGMLPGYTLSALTEVGHPQMIAAFERLLVLASTSGNYQEYMANPGQTGLQPLYEPTGALGDYTAKFRPWEGGINVAALLDTLFGFQADAFASQIRLRPHLRPTWPSMAAVGLRSGADRFDVEVRRDGPNQVLSISSDAAAPYTVVIEWDGLEAPATALSLDGTALESTVDVAFGVERRTARFTLAPGADVEVRVITAPN